MGISDNTIYVSTTAKFMKYCTYYIKTFAVLQQYIKEQHSHSWQANTTSKIQQS